MSENCEIYTTLGPGHESSTVHVSLYPYKQAGKKIAVGGNLGTPFIALLEQDPVDYFVLEISTFQLEGIKTFRPSIAIILNITPDHLDRHKTLEEYVDLKGRISAFQNDGDILVLNKDDENVMKQGKRSKAKNAAKKYKDSKK
mgnify:CR=1 FL=1